VFSFYICLVAIAIISMILFMPAFLELKRPKDNGPRQIKSFKLAYTGPFTENELKLEKAQVIKLSSALTLLPNLEV
jgi:hypothetical protein